MDNLETFPILTKKIFRLRISEGIFIRYNSNILFYAKSYNKKYPQFDSLVNFNTLISKSGFKMPEFRISRNNKLKVFLKRSSAISNIF